MGENIKNVTKFLSQEDGSIRIAWEGLDISNGSLDPLHGGFTTRNLMSSLAHGNGIIKDPDVVMIELIERENQGGDKAQQCSERRQLVEKLIEKPLFRILFSCLTNYLNGGNGEAYNPYVLFEELQLKGDKYTLDDFKEALSTSVNKDSQYPKILKDDFPNIQQWVDGSIIDEQLFIAVITGGGPIKLFSKLVLNLYLRNIEYLSPNDKFFLESFGIKEVKQDIEFNQNGDIPISKIAIKIICGIPHLREMVMGILNLNEKEFMLMLTDYINGVDNSKFESILLPPLSEGFMDTKVKKGGRDTEKNLFEVLLKISESSPSDFDLNILMNRCHNPEMHKFYSEFLSELVESEESKYIVPSGTPGFQLTRLKMVLDFFDNFILSESDDLVKKYGTLFKKGDILSGFDYFMLTALMNIEKKGKIKSNEIEELVVRDNKNKIKVQRKLLIPFYITDELTTDKFTEDELKKILSAISKKVEEKGIKECFDLKIVTKSSELFPQVVSIETLEKAKKIIEEYQQEYHLVNEVGVSDEIKTSITIDELDLEEALKKKYIDLSDSNNLYTALKGNLSKKIILKLLAEKDIISDYTGKFWEMMSEPEIIKTVREKVRDFPIQECENSYLVQIRFAHFMLKSFNKFLFEKQMRGDIFNPTPVKLPHNLLKWMKENYGQLLTTLDLNIETFEQDLPNNYTTNMSLKKEQFFRNSRGNIKELPSPIQVPNSKYLKKDENYIQQNLGDKRNYYKRFFYLLCCLRNLKSLYPNNGILMGITSTSKDEYIIGYDFLELHNCLLREVLTNKETCFFQLANIVQDKLISELGGNCLKSMPRIFYSTGDDVVDLQQQLAYSMKQFQYGENKILGEDKFKGIRVIRSCYSSIENEELFPAELMLELTNEQREEVKLFDRKLSELNRSENNNLEEIPVFDIFKKPIQCQLIQDAKNFYDSEGIIKLKSSHSDDEYTVQKKIIEDGTFFRCTCRKVNSEWIGIYNDETKGDTLVKKGCRHILSLVTGKICESKKPEFECELQFPIDNLRIDELKNLLKERYGFNYDEIKEEIIQIFGQRDDNLTNDNIERIVKLHGRPLPERKQLGMITLPAAKSGNPETVNKKKIRDQWLKRVIKKEPDKGEMIQFCLYLFENDIRNLVLKTKPYLEKSNMKLNAEAVEMNTNSNNNTGKKGGFLSFSKKKYKKFRKLSRRKKKIVNFRNIKTKKNLKKI